MPLTIECRAVFRFEVSKEITEVPHRVGEVDRRSPDGADFIGVFRRSCWGGELRSIGGRNGEVVGVRGGEPIEVAAMGARGARSVADARGCEA